MIYAIALGSNLGERLQHLQDALRLMLERLPQARLLVAAPVYESAPVDCPEDSGAFYNTVVELECEASPSEVLLILRKIEGELGRPKERAHHAPRTIDLDILCAGNLIMNEAELTLPHPRLAERRFVLQPLMDISPDLVPSGLSASVAVLLTRLKPDDDSIRMVVRGWA
ncbi:MAG: 2-amino-4-hydroxy-6-hydroxymethyldihydropteridine diphosphokinase [Verrucomicrobia bacterium]|nr:2-amino-4-hydroxy-6-hydroxymethyldihydropteridine diphosphokinase [Verrucomicrobiota bacterium]